MLSFLKVGTIGFGGGAALIPVIEEELVEQKKWMEKRELDVAVAIASISPASLPVALCSIWSKRFSLLSAFSYALPGSLIYLILLTGFSYIGEIGTMYLRFASVGLIAFVISLLIRFIKKNYSHGVKAGLKTQHILIMTASFLLTCGNALGRLTNMMLELELPTPLFSIDMLSLILMTLFVVGFAGNSKSKTKWITAFVLAGLFALANGRMGILRPWLIHLAIILLIAAIASIVYDTVVMSDKEDRKKIKVNVGTLRNLLLFIAVSLVFTIAVYIASGDINVWDFAQRVVTSSLTSFGGGEVYIGISEAVFVQTGFIPEEIYSTQIIGIANSMPGPVLVAIVAGVGFTYGNALSGIGFGWLFGLLGLSLAVTVTAVAAQALYISYEYLKESRRMQIILQNFMPVVCGMLASTALSLLIQASSVLLGEGFNEYISVGVVIAITFLMLLLHYRFRVNNLILLICGGLGTLTVLGVFAS